MKNIYNIYIYFFFLAVLGFPCCVGFSVVAVSGGCSVAVRGLLNVVASFVAEWGL